MLGMEHALEPQAILVVETEKDTAMKWEDSGLGKLRMDYDLLLNVLAQIVRDFVLATLEKYLMLTVVIPLVLLG